MRADLAVQSEEFPLTTAVYRRTGSRHRPLDLNRIAAFLIIPLLPLVTIGVSTLSLGAAVGILLLPVSMHAVVQYHGAKLLLGLWALCLIGGPVLATVTAGESGRELNLRLGARLLLFMLSSGVIVCTLLWSRSVIGSRKTAALYAGGLVAQGFSQFSTIAANPWKFGLALPITILLLAIARTRVQSTTVLAAVGGCSIFFHLRSFAGICALAILIILFAPARPITRKPDFRLLALLPLAAVVLYRVATLGLLNGWFGATMQDLALRQTRGGQVSLLLGARPESAAALALFESRPAGFGPGVVPNLNDVATAINALKQLGVNPDNPYVKEYLFGDRLELHSIVGDLWLMFGLFGLILAAALLWYLLAGLLNGANRLRSGAVGVLLGLTALWDLAFSPISAMTYVALALALLLPSRGPSIGHFQPEHGMMRPFATETGGRTTALGRYPESAGT